MKLLENMPSDHANLKNRALHLQKIGVPPAHLVSAEIIHGNNIQIVAGKDGGKVIVSADGLITQIKEIYLSITSADCLPIFLFEPKNEIIGLIHAGWRSLEKGILANAVEEIKKLGGAPENILAGVGPAICQPHYEVGPEVAKKFENYPEAIEKDNEKLFLDIKKIAELQLSGLGFKKENIEISPECTFELPEKYFSARRDRKKEVEAMVAVIGLKK